MDYMERVSHARGVCHTQYTSRMETVMMKQEEETDTRIMKRVVRNQEERNVGTKGKSPQTRPN